MDALSTQAWTNYPVLAKEHKARRWIGGTVTLQEDLVLDQHYQHALHLTDGFVPEVVADFDAPTPSEGSVDEEDDFEAEQQLEPTDEQADYDEPAYEEEEPLYGRPSYQAPVPQPLSYEEPGHNQPSYQAPVYRQPSHQAPVHYQTSYQAPVPQQSSYQASAPQQSSYPEPDYERPTCHEPAYQSPSHQKPAHEQPSYRPSLCQQTSYHDTPVNTNIRRGGNTAISVRKEASGTIAGQNAATLLEEMGIMLRTASQVHPERCQVDHPLQVVELPPVQDRVQRLVLAGIAMRAAGPLVPTRC